MSNWLRSQVYARSRVHPVGPLTESPASSVISRKPVGSIATHHDPSEDSTSFLRSALARAPQRLSSCRRIAKDRNAHCSLMLVYRTTHPLGPFSPKIHHPCSQNNCPCQQNRLSLHLALSNFLGPGQSQRREEHGVGPDWRSFSFLRVLCDLCGSMNSYLFVPRWHMRDPSGFLSLAQPVVEPAIPPDRARTQPLRPETPSGRGCRRGLLGEQPIDELRGRGSCPGPHGRGRPWS